MINRLKHERLGFPAEIKSLEATLGQKEHDYEQLLLMSHDANHSKEVARQELSKFEMLVSEERKQREKELHDCRAVLQRKQMLATDLVDNERQRKQAGLHPKALPQGSAPRLHPKALPQGSAARLHPKALPQGSAPRLCPKALLPYAPYCPDYPDCPY